MASRLAFDSAPVRVYWEITRACSLACAHCRAEAAPHADPREIAGPAALRILQDLATACPLPHVIFTGGDPLERPDLFELIAAAKSLGLGVSVSPSATPRLTDDALDRLQRAGVEAISLSIDGSTAEVHDSLRGVAGCFDRTLAAGRHAAAIGLPFQVNTLVSRATLDDMAAVETLVRSLGAARWSLFFLVSVGRGAALAPTTAEETECLLGWLAVRARLPGLVITTTEAPFFRRFIPARRAAGIRDGNGVMFIGHDGAIYPSGFLPIAAGNAALDNPLRVYQQSPLFRALRDAQGFHGRCGRCEQRLVCGGSRARAFAATGDVLAEDPLCAHQPCASFP
jgi:MoaA/NifB/PqqE/SkfB family radical SAM enzyme